MLDIVFYPRDWLKNVLDKTSFDKNAKTESCTGKNGIYLYCYFKE